MYQSNTKETCWMISFGMHPVPIHWLNKSPTHIKQDTTPTRHRVKPTDKARDNFIECINLALSNNILLYKDILAFMVEEEIKTGNKIILRTPKGQIIGERAFMNYIRTAKQDNKIKKISVRDKILDMHKNKFSFEEILLSVDCKKHYVQRVLATAGVKVKLERKDKKLKKITDK